MVRDSLRIVILFIVLIFLGCGNSNRVDLTNRQTIQLNTDLSQLDKSDDDYFYVVDGDTMKFRFDGKIVTVRLIGIDTFETHKNNKAYRQAYENNISIDEVIRKGKKAKDYAKELLLKNSEYYFEYDEQFLDRYKRTLAYLWFNKDSMLNLKMVCDGYALPLTIKPDTKYAKEFQECYEQAKERGLGVWGDSLNEK